MDLLNHQPTTKVTWSADVHVETAGTGEDEKKGKGSLTIVLDEAAKAGTSRAFSNLFSRYISSPHLLPHLPLCLLDHSVHTFPPADTQIFNTYGAKSNEELLLGYGFVLPSNPADFVALKLSLPPHCSQTLFDLIHSLKLDNLRHFVPRSGQLPDELLAQMRLLVADAEEIQEIVEKSKTAKGWEEAAGFISWENEMDVLDALEGMLMSKLAALQQAVALGDERADVKKMVDIYRRGKSPLNFVAVSTGLSPYNRTDPFLPPQVNSKASRLLSSTGRNSSTRLLRGRKRRVCSWRSRTTKRWRKRKNRKKSSDYCSYNRSLSTQSPPLRRLLLLLYRIASSVVTLLHARSNSRASRSLISFSPARAMSALLEAQEDFTDTLAQLQQHYKALPELRPLLPPLHPSSRNQQRIARHPVTAASSRRAPSSLVLPRLLPLQRLLPVRLSALPLLSPIPKLLLPRPKLPSNLSLPHPLQPKSLLHLAETRRDKLRCSLPLLRESGGLYRAISARLGATTRTSWVQTSRRNSRRTSPAAEEAGPSLVMNRATSRTTSMRW